MSPDSGATWPYLPNALRDWFDELSTGGMFVTDADLRIRAWNRWLERNTGLLASQMIARPLFDAFPDLSERGLDQYYRDAIAGEARVIAQRFHGYLLPVPVRQHGPDQAHETLMPQSARIAPLRVSGVVVGTITVIEDVSERVSSERELRNRIAELERARATAEAAVRTKDEFLATLSHELRTPLNAVLGWTRLMRTGQMDASKLARALDVVDRNATAQAQLIDDMLDVARIMQGKLRLEMQATDLVPVVLAAVDVIGPAADAKGVRLHTHIDVETAMVTGDPNRLQQVVWNLLSNAVKFTPSAGYIEVRLRERDGEAEVAITDSGKGIAPDFLPYVFDRFRQEDSTTTRRYGGLGLGLSLVRQLLELHGGSVRAESAGEGLGSSFVFTLPLRPSNIAPTRGVCSRGVDSALAAVAGHRILIVDDEADARDVLSAALAEHGACVVAVGSAEEAYHALQASPGERPEVIVADIGMPDEDGYNLLQTVRALPAERGGGIPAIAVTGYAGPDDREQALRAGFQVHFAKPVDPAELAGAVVQLLSDTRTSEG